MSSYDISIGSVKSKITQMLRECPCCSGIPVVALYHDIEENTQSPQRGWCAYIYCGSCYIQTLPCLFIESLDSVQSELYDLVDIWNRRPQ